MQWGTFKQCLRCSKKLNLYLELFVFKEEHQTWFLNKNTNHNWSFLNGVKEI